MSTQPMDQSSNQPVPNPIPTGYRQGIITAITVLLGFSLAFFRYWGFEASGAWSATSIIAAITFVAAIVLQIVALFRSLRLVDDDRREYEQTVRWFIASSIVLLVGLLIAVVVYAGTGR
jgi:heme O synthase-like polyprenyltransferase